MHWFDEDDPEELIEDWQPRGGDAAREQPDIESLDFKAKLKDAIDVTEESEDPGQDSSKEPTEGDEPDEPSIEERIDLDEVRQKARQKGYEEGYEEGFKEGEANRQELEKQIRQDYESAIEEGLAEIAQFTRSIERKLPGKVVDIAEVFARRLVDEFIRRDDEALRSLAAETIRRAGGFDRIELYGSPETVDILQRFIQQLRREHPEGATIELHEDESLEYGDLRIQSDKGSVENILDERLSRLSDAASDVVGGLEMEEFDKEAVEPAGPDSVEKAQTNSDHSDDPDSDLDRQEQTAGEETTESSETKIRSEESIDEVNVSEFIEQEAKEEPVETDEPEADRD